MTHDADLAEIIEEFRALVVALREFGAEPQAFAVERCADIIKARLLRGGDRLLDLRAAAQVSGYSADHLSRMLREGKIPNAGRKSRPLIRRRDLPVKTRKREEEPCLSSRGGYVPVRLFRDVIHSKLGADDAQD